MQNRKIIFFSGPSTSPALTAARKVLTFEDKGEDGKTV